MWLWGGWPQQNRQRQKIQHQVKAKTFCPLKSQANEDTSTLPEAPGRIVSYPTLPRCDFKLLTAGAVTHLPWVPAPQPRTKAHRSCLLQGVNSQAQQQQAQGGACQDTKKRRKMQSFLTKGKCCIPAESLWLPTHPLDPGYLQAKHKTKDICLKPTGEHCDSIEEKNTTGIHSKNFPPLGLGFKTSTGAARPKHTESRRLQKIPREISYVRFNKNKTKSNVYKGKKRQLP